MSDGSGIVLTAKHNPLAPPTASVALTYKMPSWMFAAGRLTVTS